MDVKQKYPPLDGWQSSYETTDSCKRSSIHISADKTRNLKLSIKAAKKNNEVHSNLLSLENDLILTAENTEFIRTHKPNIPLITENAFALTIKPSYSSSSLVRARPLHVHRPRCKSRSANAEELS